MIETLLVVVAVVVVIGFGLIIFIIMTRLKLTPDTSAQLLKVDLQTLNQSVERLRDGLQTNVSDRIERNQAFMQTSLQKQLSESAKLITDVTQRLTKLDETNLRVANVADDLKMLQNVLQNPKQRGVLGEYFLQSVLENVLPPERFKLQQRIGKGDDGRDLICDAVIFLDKQKMLPIDSKFSLENYNRLLEETDKTRQEVLIKAIKADLKNRIDETAKYIRPKDGTMDFAFMFIPSEAIYYDLLINKVGTLQTTARDLIEYAFQEKHVIIVSPTSFMAYLQTVMQGLRSLQIEEQAKEIQIRVGQLGRHIATYETFMQKLGSSLGTTVNHYNTAHKELKKIDKDVVKIAGNTPSVEPLLVDSPQHEE